MNFLKNLFQLYIPLQKDNINSMCQNVCIYGETSMFILLKTEQSSTSFSLDSKGGEYMFPMCQLTVGLNRSALDKLLFKMNGWTNMRPEGKKSCRTKEKSLPLEMIYFTKWKQLLEDICFTLFVRHGKKTMTEECIG